MSDLNSFLKELLSAAGISGYEHQVRGIIENEWRPLVDEISTSALGSVHGLRKGTGDEPRRKILLAGHMDAIGLMVTEVQGEFLRFTRVGGVDPRVLPGQPVLVHGREILPGIVVQPPAALLPEEIKENPVSMEYLWIDVGLEAEQVSKLVRPGDPVSFAQEPLDLSGEVLTGHTLDDRAAVAAITTCLHELQSRVHTWDVWAVATVQEETTFGGAYTSTFGLTPDIGIAIDVCQAQGPGTNEARIPILGKGLVLGLGPNVHPYLYKTMKKVADELEIPSQINVHPTHSGTDAYAIQVSLAGVPSMVVSIPLRYMHTPVETVSLKDIRRVGRLLAEFITHLDAGFFETIGWDD